MKQLWKDILAAVGMGLVLPGLVVNGAVMLWKPPEPVQAPVVTEYRPVKVRTEDQVTEMDLDRYLTRVVLAEMPASFDPEALKAQSVAARTYACKAAATGGKHGDGSICTEASCCQGYIREEAYLEKGGTREDVDKVAAAVADTSGYVLTYEGELIEATYFSCSGGATEDAAAVWGTEYPYLQSVTSPEEGAQRYAQTLSFTPMEFQELLGRELPGSAEHWFTIVTYTEGGGVASMVVGGETYSGTELRSLLGLRSTAFTVEATSERIDITTQGYGHRVGLSQYGAETMAVSGSSFEEILAHYYPGTDLVQLGFDEIGEREYDE